MLPKSIRQEAAKYACGDIVRQESFIAGAMYATTGKYYKTSELFCEPQTTEIQEIATEPIVRLKDGIIPAFDEWWNAYNKKRGRKKAEAKWNKLKPKDKIACMKATPAYVVSTPDVQFRKDPTTYLNGECWKDEIIKPVDYEQQRVQRLADRTANLINSAYTQR